MLAFKYLEWNPVGSVCKNPEWSFNIIVQVLPL